MTNLFIKFIISCYENENFSFYNCILIKNQSKCEKEWDMFTQFYCPSMYCDKYENISVFERY